MITNGFTYVAVLLFAAGVLVTLEKTAKEVSTRLEDEARQNTNPVTAQSLLLLIGCAFLVSAIATNMGAKLYDLTGFSDKSTWTVLFVTAVALICAVTPLATLCANIMKLLA